MSWTAPPRLHRRLLATLLHPVAPLGPDEKIKELRIWTDTANTVVQGVYIVTTSGKRLNGGGVGRLLTEADVVVKAPDLATGVLLGVTVATKPKTEVLSAISFNFLKVPTSSAIAIDMPSININELEFRPQVSIQSSTR
jgi:hypothetical protein